MGFDGGMLGTQKALAVHLLLLWCTRQTGTLCWAWEGDCRLGHSCAPWVRLLSCYIPWNFVPFFVKEILAPILWMLNLMSPNLIFSLCSCLLYLKLLGVLKWIMRENEDEAYHLIHTNPMIEFIHIVPNDSARMRACGQYCWNTIMTMT